MEDSEEEKKNHEELKRLAKEAMGGVFPQVFIALKYDFQMSKI